MTSATYLPWNIPSNLENDFQLFTSLRYDPKLLNEEFNTAVAGGEKSPYLLSSYHVERLREATIAFNWRLAKAVMNAPEVTEKIRKRCDDAVAKEANAENGLMLRILLSRMGAIRVEALPAAPLTRGALDAFHFNPDTFKGDTSKVPQPVLPVYIDTESTLRNMFTSYKTTEREHYDAARKRAGLGPERSKEVILYNKQDEIMEASVHNVAFWREGGWVTPANRSGGLPGTVRRWLLERGLLKEKVIYKDEVRDGDWVLLMNGVDVTVLGRVESRRNGKH